MIKPRRFTSKHLNSFLFYNIPISNHHLVKCTCHPSLLINTSSLRNHLRIIRHSFSIIQTTKAIASHFHVLQAPQPILPFHRTTKLRPAVSTSPTVLPTFQPIHSTSNSSIQPKHGRRLSNHRRLPDYPLPTCWRLFGGWVWGRFVD